MLFVVPPCLIKFSFCLLLKSCRCVSNHFILIQSIKYIQYILNLIIIKYNKIYLITKTPSSKKKKTVKTTDGDQLLSLKKLSQYLNQIFVQLFLRKQLQRFTFVWFKLIYQINLKVKMGRFKIKMLDVLIVKKYLLELQSKIFQLVFKKINILKN